MNSDLESIIKWNYELDELEWTLYLQFRHSLRLLWNLMRKVCGIVGVEFGKIDNIQVFHDIAHRSTQEADQMANGSRFSKIWWRRILYECKRYEFAAYEPRGAIGQGLGYMP